MSELVQTSLLCGCGASEFRRDGLCTRCLRRARLSAEKFDGLRELILRRDDHQCQICGERDVNQIVVHHRVGVNCFITLCRACHVRVHRTFRPSFGFLTVALLKRLWREANRGLAEQRVLALLAEEARRESQPGLFEGAEDDKS